MKQLSWVLAESSLTAPHGARAARPGIAGIFNFVVGLCGVDAPFASGRLFLTGPSTGAVRRPFLPGNARRLAICNGRASLSRAGHARLAVQPRKALPVSGKNRNGMHRSGWRLSCKFTWPAPAGQRRKTFFVAPAQRFKVSCEGAAQRRPGCTRAVATT